ncbi:MAG: magnesium chelatase ATPase subunit I [Alphaproteobacteria bacterium]|nr:magnesium chelatase ATPase subunit I [Alphaproteobacteria bacterium]
MNFPFSAIVGQEEMKRALLMAAVDPTIGGVLVFGDRGTGKSTAVRALAALLPEMEVVEGCRYHCDPADRDRSCSEACSARLGREELKISRISVPVVDLPLGATEDRIIGALDIEKALTLGEKSFEPGLLARANRGFLYIDEVNLLEDHLVDLLLDVAATGENVVEREGLSIRHPARFVLVGSGNPEEGELRPQLLDRFGLSVEVTTPKSIDERIEVIKRRDAFERNAQEFSARFAEDEAGNRQKIEKARAIRSHIMVSDSVLGKAAELCLALGTDGLRGELTLIRAARALAALEGCRELGVLHLQEVAASALRHRLRRDPLEEAGSTARIERALEEVFR